MIYKKRAITTLSIFIALLMFSTTVNAEPKQKLPRSYGPLYLGMSVKEFKKITSAPVGRCTECVEDEQDSILNIDTAMAATLKISPNMPSKSSIKYQPANLKPDRIICSFYKGHLYRIILEGIEDIPEAVKDRYVKIFGKPYADDWDTGISEYRWRRFNTSLSIVYKKGAKSMHIIYDDVKILKQAQKAAQEEEEDFEKNKIK